jgi:hypothetical protein
VDFGTVIWIVVLVVAPIAAVLFAGAFGLLDELGRGDLAIDESPPRPSPRPGSPLERVERETEIRQLVQARHERRLGRGQDGIDVEAEVSRLLALDPESGPDEGERHDAALRAEVRQLVIARNERRLARGDEPLDVDAEVERQLAELRPGS